MVSSSKEPNEYILLKGINIENGKTTYFLRFRISHAEHKNVENAVNTTCGRP